MSEIAGAILFTAWAGLIVLGLRPELGARFGLWLRGAKPAPPPPRKPSEVERPDEVPPNGIDRYV